MWPVGPPTKVRRLMSPSESHLHFRPLVSFGGAIKAHRLPEQDGTCRLQGGFVANLGLELSGAEAITQLHDGSGARGEITKNCTATVSFRH